MFTWLTVRDTITDITYIFLRVNYECLNHTLYVVWIFFISRFVFHVFFWNYKNEE